MFTIAEEETEAQRGPEVQPLALGHTETANGRKCSQSICSVQSKNPSALYDLLI